MTPSQAAQRVQLFVCPYFYTDSICLECFGASSATNPPLLPGTRCYVGGGGSLPSFALVSMRVDQF